MKPATIAKAQAKLEQHFDSDALSTPAEKAKRWSTFRSAIKGTAFTDAVLADPRADEKLKAFAAIMHTRATDAVPASRIRGKTGTYTIKYHPGLQRISCTCPDWTYKHSIGGGDCKHVKEMIMRTKTASGALAAFRPVTRGIFRPMLAEDRVVKRTKKHQTVLDALEELKVLSQRAKEAEFYDLLGRAAERVQRA